MLLLKLLKAHFKNQKILLKSSITLFETIVSLLILLVVVGGFLKIPYDNHEDEEIFYTINEIENRFDTKEYQYFLKQEKFLNITKNDVLVETISVNKYLFKNKSISIFKYEK